MAGLNGDPTVISLVGTTKDGDLVRRSTGVEAGSIAAWLLKREAANRCFCAFFNLLFFTVVTSPPNTGESCLYCFLKILKARYVMGVFIAEAGRLIQQILLDFPGQIQGTSHFVAVS